jgi:predicted nucleotidyltransferase component of viral defense system
MQDLIRQEKFELEVLEKLNSGKFLDNFIFTGGTMLRLCFGLPRFSTDLDFWVLNKVKGGGVFADIGKYLSGSYTVRDSADKYYTMLYEIKSPEYPRSLKIEIRKEAGKVQVEQAIAYSQYSNIQVLLKAAKPEEMMIRKIDAFLERKEIRDVFDMEFLIKKGIKPDAPAQKLKMVLKGIEGLSKNDYKVKLGSLLESGMRKYYISENFKILINAIREQIPNNE